VVGNRMCTSTGGARASVVAAMVVEEVDRGMNRTVKQSTYQLTSDVAAKAGEEHGDDEETM